MTIRCSISGCLRRANWRSIWWMHRRGSMQSVSKVLGFTLLMIGLIQLTLAEIGFFTSS